MLKYWCLLQVKMAGLVFRGHGVPLVQILLFLLLRPRCENLGNELLTEQRLVVREHHSKLKTGSSYI